MRALVISDIHGIKSNLNIIKDKYTSLNCEKLIVLGDLYWKNKDSKDYDPKYVQKFLKDFSNNIICIKGNCDFNVNPINEPFPIHKDKVVNLTDNIYITHGNLYNETNWIIENSILIFGHYHTPFIKKIKNNLYINTGSISTQRGLNKPTYLYINDCEFIIYDIDNKVISSYKIK